VPRTGARLLVAGCLAWTAFVHVVLFVLDMRGRAAWGDETRYLASARALLAGDPSWWPMPFWPPLQTHFLAGVFVLGGSWKIVYGLFLGFLLLVAAVAFGDLVGKASGSRDAGFIAAWLMLSYPPLVAFTHYLWPEVLHLFLMISAIWILLEKSRSILWCAAAGIVLGLALLTKSLLGPFIPLLLIVTLWKRDNAWRNAAVVIGMIVLVLLPVLSAQNRRLGRPMIADSSAFNLWVGLNDRGRKNFQDEYVARAFEDFKAADGDFFSKNAELRRRSIELIRHRGIVRILESQLGRQYFRLFDRENYMGEQLNEGAAVRQGFGYKDSEALPAIGLRWASYVMYVGILCAFPFSLLVRRWSEPRLVAVLSTFLLYNLLLFLLFHVKSRYRIQLLPVFFLAAPMFSCFFGFNGRFRPGILRRAAAGVLAILGLYLAFGGR